EKDSNTNLLKNTGTTLKTNTTYQVLLWSDKNGNGTYDAGENVWYGQYKLRIPGNVSRYFLLRHPYQLNGPESVRCGRTSDPGY
ncbi:hypothetical protein MJN69_30570, partial [Salmonella enterica subsp. enterica serovar Kentucky]|nr:hypothetical protein [Salmonella enterica subsp. enterica serovar Kentucky]